MPALITPADLAPFAKIDPVKAAAMCDDALALAAVHAPCILQPDLDAGKARAAKAIIRGAILRWNEAGAGAVVSQTAGSYSQTVDNRQARKGMFYPSEVDQLKKLCESDDRDGGAFSIDLLPRATLVDVQQAFERDTDMIIW